MNFWAPRICVMIQILSIPTGLSPGSANAPVPRHRAMAGTKPFGSLARNWLPDKEGGFV